MNGNAVLQYVVIAQNGVLVDIAERTDNVVVTEFCLPMAAVLLVSGQEGKRSALPHSRVMIHQPLGGVQGQASDIDPRRHFINGLAEAVKAGLLADPELFSIFEKEDVDDRIGDIICRSLRFKKSIVEQDETEQGMRKALNFGHTIGHGIEAVKGIKGRRTTGLFHGECVALGMLPMIESKALQKRVRGVYRRLGLPTRTAYDKEKVLAEMLHDKKAQDGQITIIKVPGLGCWRAETIPVEGLRPLLGMED